MRAGMLPGNTRTALFPLSEAERGSGPNKEGGVKIEGREGRGEWMDGEIPQGKRAKDDWREVGRGSREADRSTAIYPEEYPSCDMSGW